MTSCSLRSSLAFLLVACSASTAAHSEQGPASVAPDEGGEGATTEDADLTSTRPVARGVVGRRGRTLVLDGKPFRFVGVNIAGLAHYGASRDVEGSEGACPVCRWGKQGDIAVQLDAAKSAGARVIRIFAANVTTKAPPASAYDELADRIGAVLDQAATRGLKVIVSFIDEYRSPYRLAEDDGFYTLGSGRLDDDFFSEDRSPNFRTHYLPWVEHLVGRFASRPEIFSWELGNELRNLDRPDEIPGRGRGSERFLHFSEIVTARIRELDSQHIISPGMISMRGFDDAQRLRFYANPNLDLITTHNYNGDRTVEDDSLTMALAGKPLLIEESGINLDDLPKSPALDALRAAKDRSPLVDGDMRFWLEERGAVGYMPWGFVALSHDFGDGDARFGVDKNPNWHAPDFDRITGVMSAHAATLAGDSRGGPCAGSRITLGQGSALIRAPLEAPVTVSEDGYRFRAWLTPTIESDGRVTLAAFGGGRRLAVDGDAVVTSADGAAAFRVVLVGDMALALELDDGRALVRGDGGALVVAATSTRTDPRARWQVRCAR